MSLTVPALQFKIGLKMQKQEKHLISQIRSEFSFWGCDTSDMTDEELAEGVKFAGQQMSKMGLTCDELGKALKTMANCEAQCS